jgi:myo-inositol-1(or 4)-monophosphatase
VILDPLRRESFCVAAGERPLLNGEPLAPSTRADLPTAMVATGFGYDAAVRRAQAAQVAELLPRVRDIRRLGSAALDLAWTAAGRFDAYYERGVQPWDVAAGLMLCEAAGLSVATLAARDELPAGVLVAPDALAGPLLELVG